VFRATATPYETSNETQKGERHNPGAQISGNMKIGIADNK
jgi:hypothetical protein